MEKHKPSIVFTGDVGFDRYMDRKWEDALIDAVDNSSLHPRRLSGRGRRNRYIRCLLHDRVHSCHRDRAGQMLNVFINIPGKEFELLAPLSAKAFVAENMRKMILPRT